MTPVATSRRAAALGAIGRAAGQLEPAREFATMADRIEALDAAVNTACCHAQRAGDEALTDALLSIGADVTLWLEALTAEAAM